MVILARNIGLFLLATTLIAHGCAGVQLISEESVESKLARIKLGATTKAEVEDLLGTDHGAENLRWVYSLRIPPLATGCQ